MKNMTISPMRMVLIALSAFAMLSLSACGSQAKSQRARVDKLFAPWNTKDTPGCAVGISRNGAIVYEHGYGMANLEHNVPITPDTVFPIASISKSFTAMSVLLAAEHGQLSLDDEVQKYIPEWADRDDHVTIRQLLNHMGGLRDAFTLLGWAPPSESAGDQNEAIVRMLARQRGLNFAPGTEYEYNNGGYNLLASILKRATGQSLRAFADANIFKPLGMTHSNFSDDPTMPLAESAFSYSRNANGWTVLKEHSGIVGNAGMYSSVGDLLRWEQNFDDVRVGTPPMLAAMQAPITLSSGKTSPHGIGLGIEEYRGLQTVGSSGGDHGIATKIVRFPGQRFAVAVLCNEDSVVMGGMARVNPDVFTNGIADIYLGDVLRPVDANPNPAPAPTTAPVTLSDKELSDTTGLYRLVSRDWPILISVNRGVLLWRSYYQDDQDFQLTPVGPNLFLFQGMAQAPVEFVPSTGGKPKQWRIGPAGTDQGVLLPVTFVTPASELSSYTGDYRSDEIRATYTIAIRDSMLAVKNTIGEATIRSVSKDVFASDYFGIVKFSRDARGAIIGFTMNRGGAHDVWFDRSKPTR